MNGWYPYIFGLALNKKIKDKILPKMTPYLTKEDYAYYENVLKNNKTGMDPINKGLYMKMFGFKTYDELLEN